VQIFSLNGRILSKDARELVQRIMHSGGKAIAVFFRAARLIAAINPDNVVIGGGDGKKLKKLPRGCRAGDNKNAFVGGFPMSEEEGSGGGSPGKKVSL
jgi:hypothetical protein